MVAKSRLYQSWNLNNIMDLNTVHHLQAKLALAEEQLMLSDDMSQQCYWGDQCDQLEAAIYDAIHEMHA